MEKIETISDYTNEKKTPSLEIVPIDVIKITETVEDEATRSLLLKYASLYLNDYLGRLNDAEKYSYQEAMYELEKLEKVDHIVWSASGQIEGILLDYGNKIKATKSIDIAA